MSDELHFCGTAELIVEAAVAAWRKPEITYAVAGSLPGVSGQQFREAAGDAFAAWGALIPRRFRESSPGEVPDVLITTGRIDGPNSVLAWSELPDGTDRQLAQKYDTSERFALAERPARGQIDLLAVLCHEIGHALGLDHAPAGSPDLMAPAYQPGRRQPQPGDKARIQKLYGAAPPPPPPTGKPIVIRIWGADRIEVEGYEVRPKE